MQENSRRKILITNDDGVNAGGIVRLAAAAKEFGDVWVVAPDSQRSAMSHSITLQHSFTAWPVEFPVEGVRAWACSGTPADCVRIGILNIVPGKPDCVLSGINFGYNVATDIQYSATAAAAFEASFQGVHAIAFSESNAPKCHEDTDFYLRDIMKELLDQPLGIQQIWNVNFPGCPLAECRGILKDRKVSGNVFFKDSYIETALPDGKTSYMVKGKKEGQAEEDTDLWAIFNNYISIGIVNNVR